MKKLVLVLCFLPILTLAQSKRKQRLAAEKADAALLANLQKHVQFLADDQLEGRRTGTRGETMAMEYLVQYYQQLGIPAAGSNDYVQPFEINEGKKIDASTTWWVRDRELMVMKEYFPLAYSALGSLASKPAMVLSEKGQPWFLDLKEILEENKNNPHFDVDEVIRKQAESVKTKGATALLVYNSTSITDNVQFNKNDKTAPSPIPVLYITAEGFRNHFSDPSASLPMELKVSISEKTRQAHNVVAFINNNAPHTVILGAHYDHLGYGEDKNALDTAHAIHNGADDNASGTAALMELAAMLKTKAPAGNNYLIIHFSGEELGLFGSKYWIEHPTVKISPNYMINMDMVGRYDTAHKLTVGGYGTSPVWGELWKNLPTTLLTHFDSTGSGPSDHASFYRANIPVQFFFTGSHADYHKASDDWDKINYAGQREVVKLVYNLIGAADTKGKLSFTKTAEPQVGRATFTVSLGIMPDYGYSGTGVRVDGVVPGKLAEKTGLQAGDILLQLGEFKFVDVMSYMQSLKKFNKGDTTQLRIRRGSDEKTFEITF